MSKHSTIRLFTIIHGLGVKMMAMNIVKVVSARMYMVLQHTDLDEICDRVPREISRNNYDSNFRKKTSAIAELVSEKILEIFLSAISGATSGGVDFIILNVFWWNFCIKKMQKERSLEDPFLTT